MLLSHNDIKNIVKNDTFNFKGEIYNLYTGIYNNNHVAFCEELIQYKIGDTKQKAMDSLIKTLKFIESRSPRVKMQPEIKKMERRNRADRDFASIL